MFPIQVPHHVAKRLQNRGNLAGLAPSLPAISLLPFVVFSRLMCNEEQSPTEKRKIRASIRTSTKRFEAGTRSWRHLRGCPEHIGYVPGRSGVSTKLVDTELHPTPTARLHFAMMRSLIVGFWDDDGAAETILCGVSSWQFRQVVL